MSDAAASLGAEADTGWTILLGSEGQIIELLSWASWAAGRCFEAKPGTLLITVSIFEGVTLSSSFQHCCG